MRYLVLIILIFISGETMAKENSKNVLRQPLEQCGTDPITGFFRDGYCNTGISDSGSHVVAAIMTEEFLDFTKSRGNDLQTPRPEYNFPGLKPGDKWCLCALRWREAHEAGVAPPVIIGATHEKALNYIPLEILKQYQVQ
jgi:uncharacterized protein (DUF2237 family)